MKKIPLIIFFFTFSLYAFSQTCYFIEKYPNLILYTLSASEKLQIAEDIETKFRETIKEFEEIDMSQLHEGCNLIDNRCVNNTMRCLHYDFFIEDRICILEDVFNENRKLYKNSCTVLLMNAIEQHQKATKYIHSYVLIIWDRFTKEYMVNYLAPDGGKLILPGLKTKR